MKNQEDRFEHNKLHEAEYKAIRSDLWRVLAVNVVFLVALFALFYYNQSTNFLEKQLFKYIHI